MHSELNEQATWVGKSVRRFEDHRLLTGGGQYVDDVAIPGVLSLAVYRSPYPHARLLSIDVSAAREAPGVIDVITGADVKGPGRRGVDALRAERKESRAPTPATGHRAFLGRASRGSVGRRS